MLDTTLEYALQQTIIDFNAWSMTKASESKYSINEIKGIFLNKLRKNLEGNSTYSGKIANYRHNHNKIQLDINILYIIEVVEGKIETLKFNPMPGYNDLLKGMTTALNSLIENKSVNLKLYNNDNHISISSLASIPNKILNFKIR